MIWPILCSVSPLTKGFLWVKRFPPKSSLYRNGYKQMLKAKRSLVLVLIIGLMSAMGTSIAKAEVGTFLSNGNVIHVEQGQPVTLENLTGQECLGTCVWSVLDFDSGITWSADRNGDMTGTALNLGAFDVELQGLGTELVGDSFVTTNIYSTSFRIYVVQGQTVTFDPIVGTSFEPGTVVLVNATASTRLPVTYTSLTPTICSVNSTSGSVSLNTAGLCEIEASRPADLLWIDASDVISIQSGAVQSGQIGGASTGGTTPGAVTPAALMPQTISFGPIQSQQFTTGSITVSATATSGLPVSFSAVGTCSVGATTGLITFTGAGQCTITASQAGSPADDSDNRPNRGNRDRDDDDDEDGYAAAVDVVQSFSIMADQTITLNNPGNQYFVANATVSAVAVSFTPVSPVRPVTYTSSTTAVCTVDSATGVVTILAVGDCSITGSQAGTTFLNPTSAGVTFTVSNKLSQTINFLNPGEKVLGVAPFSLVATASPSGLPITYSSNTPNVCTVVNDVVTVLTSGICSITASQGGNGMYSAATSVTQPFAVVLGTTNVINVGQQGNRQLQGSQPFNLNATATSGLTVTYLSANTSICTVDAAGLVTIMATGTCSITLSQAGNGTYPAALDVLVSFEVTAAAPASNQTIDVTTPSNRSFVSNETIQLDGRATSTLPVVYSSNSEAVCTVSPSGLITIKSVGVCSIAVNQPGNASYNPAPGKIVEFTINEVVPNIIIPPLPIIPPPPPVVIEPPVVNLNGLVTIYNGEARPLTPTAGAARCTTTYNGSRIAPRDAGTYAVVATCVQGGVQSSATSTLVIKKAKPAIEWFDPSSITTKTKLSRTQLNAKANVAGSFAYVSQVGSTLPEGIQPLKAVFTPRDSRNYESVDVSVNIVVTRTKLQAIVIPFDMGSSNLSRATRAIVAQIKSSGAQAVTVLGYVKPSSSLRADQVLSLARANQVRAAVIELMPDIRVSVQALDRQRNPLCDFAENKCAVITE